MLHSLGKKEFRDCQVVQYKITNPEIADSRHDHGRFYTLYVIVYKTRQDKTRQDKTRQDKTRQDKTRQDKTRQDILIFLKL